MSPSRPWMLAACWTFSLLIKMERLTLRQVSLVRITRKDCLRLPVFVMQALEVNLDLGELFALHGRS